MVREILFREEKSGLSARAVALPDKAPQSCEFLGDLLSGGPVAIPSLHAMWTGPEISCPLPEAEIPAGWAHAVLPPENATMFPAAGDVILAYVPPRAWGGVPHAIFDIGLFYAPGGRLLLPVGWVAGSLVAQVVPQDLADLRRACEAIRRSGACTMTVEAVA